MPQGQYQKIQSNSEIKTILLHLPEDMVGDLNTVSKRLGIARAELIRRCLSRDLAFVKTVELKGMSELGVSLSKQYQEQMF